MKGSIKLVSDYHRQRAIDMVRSAPDGYHVSVKEPTRNLDQNARLWAMLSDVSKHEPEGRKLTPDDWKVLFMHGCGWECQFLDGLDGRPFPVGFRSSRLTKKQFANLIEFIYEYGNRHGVRWSEPEPEY